MNELNFPAGQDFNGVANELRAIFRSSTLNKETAKEKFQEWYKTVNQCFS